MTNLHNKKAQAFRGSAAIATAALIIFTAVFMLTGCPNAFGGGGSAENIIIKYDTERISVYMQGTNNTWDVISPNTKVYAGRQLSFNIKNLPAGQQVDKWKVNGTEIPYNWYIVNLSDAVDEGTQKAITVTYTTKAAEAVVVKFDANTITVWGNEQQIQMGDTVYEGWQLSFNVKNLPAGQQVDKWKVNGKEIQGNGYRINIADAVDDGTQKVITVAYTTKAAEAVVVKFDETHINVGLNGTFIPTGHTVYEGGQLSFSAKNLPAGQQVDKWRVNTKELKSRFYTINVSDAVDDGTQKVITVTYTTKAAG